jgi:phospholipase A1
MSVFRLTLLVACCVLPTIPAHATSAAEWESCSAISADPERLACYDRLAGRPQPLPAPQPAQAAPPPDIVGERGSDLLSALSRHWELDDDAKQGAFLFRAHRPNYFMPLKYSTAPNTAPFASSATSPDFDSTETELQLSFKVKGMQGVFGHDNLDLWFGYTVTSFWQAYNSDISSPFRETNYEPEMMWVFRTDYSLAGFRGRFINLGLVHQSNGRGEDLSRSWNRVYAQFGFERDNLALLVRPWYRLPEPTIDDNPDIEDYYGHGDVQAFYTHGRNTWSLLLRNNFDRDDNRGALKLNWSFPLHGRLRGYVQYFTGYGESLIDYNHRQQSLGLGVSLTGGI